MNNYIKAFKFDYHVKFFQALLKLILEKITRIEKHIFNQGKDGDAVQAASMSSGDRVNGVDVSSLPAKDAYNYALILLGTLFSKEELGRSLMYQSSKSHKPGLDPKRVKKLLNLVQKCYTPKEYDMKILISKINQKCRDSNIVRVKKELVHPPESKRKEDVTPDISIDSDE